MAFPLCGQPDSNITTQMLSITLREVVWGDETHMGLDQKACTPHFLTAGAEHFNGRYNLSHFDPTGRGCQVADLTADRAVTHGI